MKLIQKITWDLPDLAYFTDELGWPVTSMDEIIEQIKNWDESDLIQLLGHALDYECYVTKIEDNENE